jgi:nucleotide-binding universal stress UspA family protein
MSYKAIVVVASGTNEDARVLSMAAKVAKQCSAELRVAPAYPDPAANYAYYGASLKPALAAETASRILAAEREAQARLEALASQAAKSEGLQDEVLVEPRELAFAAALARAVVLGDLVLFGAAAARDPFLVGGLFAETLLHARSTILLVKEASWSTDSMAVAWDGSAQAGRAVRAALPLLRMARQATIITNVDDVETTAKAAEPGRLQSYLALHGVADTVTRAVRGADVAKSVLEAAQGCGVLVAGAYGRPRLFELVLGGTTRALVNAEHGPHLLLAH